MRRDIAACIVSAGTLMAAATLVACSTGTAHRGTATALRKTSPAHVAMSRRAVPPRFFFDFVDYGAGYGPLQVRDSATGRLLAQDMNLSGSVTAMAAIGARSLVFAVQVETKNLSSCPTRLYQLDVSSRGKPGQLAPLRPELHGVVHFLAASADGRAIGYAISGCGKGQPGYLGVLDLRTGRTRQWSDVNVAGESPGNVSIRALSMSADGRLLAITGSDAAGNWHQVGRARETRQVVRVLPASAPSGMLARRSRVVLTSPVSGPALGDIALSPGGGSFYLCTSSPHPAGSAQRIDEYATATGARQQVITKLTGNPMGLACQMALDRTGRVLLLINSLGISRYPGSWALSLARINLTTRSVALLSIKVPESGHLPWPGFATAW